MFNLLSKSKILVIDDFAGFRQTIKTMLGRLGAQHIDQSSNGSEAVKRCSEEDYDIIFCDYNLGDGQDGHQILEELHQRSLMRKGALFIMVTAETTSAQVMGAIEYRPDSYLTKPFTGEQLGQRLLRLILKNTALNNIYIAINAGQLTKAIETCDAVITETPKLKYSCLRIKAELLDQTGRNDELLALYNEVINEQPVLWAMVGLGRLYFKTGDVPRALEHFLSMQETFSRQVSLLDWIAKCQNELGQIEKSEETLKEAVAISPKSVMRQATLGTVAASLNNYELAQKAFEKTIHEGTYSCMQRPQHFEHYYDNSREVVNKLKGRELSKILAQTETVYKKMERAYQNDPTAMAANLSSVALLFSSAGRSDRASAILSKLTKTLENPECKLSEKQADTISKNMKSFAQEKSTDKYLDQISSRIDIINQEIKVEKQAPGQAVIAKKANAEGIQLSKQGHHLEALIKFREAIKILPDNINYLLNAAQIIIEYKELNSDPETVKEAMHYLQEKIHMDESDIRWKRYQKLLERVKNG
ncbi:MAG: response regulator [Gammaproteobacteria bacterium]|nr:response regulator [Gammaproteobacteria bacterium]